MTEQSNMPISPGRSLISVAICAVLACFLAGRTHAADPDVGLPTYVSPRVTPLKVTVPPPPPESAGEAIPAPAPMVTVPEGEPVVGPPPPRAPLADPVIQDKRSGAYEFTPFSLGRLTRPLINVPGLVSAANPPDTVGDIGRRHFVQMVNATQFRIWNKAGVALTGAIEFGSLWPAGEICNSSTGDPIVVYDHLADRWLLSQFAFPNHMCVAISRTSNPAAGTWYLYTFDTLAFPDYPKFGVWPNGYFMSTYEGATLGIYVFDRTNMVLGFAAGFMKTTIPSLGAPGVRDTRILPADLDGTPPPGGRPPGYFVRTVDDQQDTANPTDRVEVFEALPDWVNLTLAFTLVNTLAPAPFQTMLCDRNGGGFRDCIPQPAAGVNTVDALSNRPMMQLKYRNFGSFETLVFNQTIDVSGSIPFSLGFVPAGEVAGIRWYQLRRSGGAWSIYQQGTYAPQPLGATTDAQLLHRWMGSAAIDRRGNIALGYSITNSDVAVPVFPGIRYTGRLYNDPLDLLPQGERVIRNGANAQTQGTGARWGDYSALSVDPVDNCTFWYTTHLAGQGGNGPRPTRIASFRFLNCLK